MNLFTGSSASHGSILSLRRRSVWEAADSGILLWRKNFVFFIPFFAVPVWIAACALRLLPIGIDSMGFFSLPSIFPYLALWWLKPLFDRMALHVVSVRFFDSSANSRDIRRSLFKTAFRGVLGDLLWRRFNPGRGAQMPIRILERLDRRQYKQRKKSLAAGGLNFCFLLSGLGLFMEGALLAGEIIFSAIALRMIQPSFGVYLSPFMFSVEILVFAAYCLNFILIESLYVCMGFSLYINSRVEIEGWDLQLLFRKFAGQDSDQKEEDGSKKPLAETRGRGEIRKLSVSLCATAPLREFLKVGTRTLLFVMFFSAMLFGPASRPVYAEPWEEAHENPERELEHEIDTTEYFPVDFPFPPVKSLEELEAVLSSKDFGGVRESWRIRYKFEDEIYEAEDLDIPLWMERMRAFFSYMLRFLVILAIAGFIGYAASRLIRIYRNSQWRKKGARGKGKIFANPLMSPESPESLFAMAEVFFERGEAREAWSACLSACLGALSRNYLLSFPADATEYGCLALVSRKLPEEAGGFGELVRNWVLLAYGGRVPAREDFTGALAYGRSLLEGSRESAEPLNTGEAHEPQ